MSNHSTIRIESALRHTDWAKLAQQKAALLAAMDAVEAYPEPVREGDPLDGATEKLEGLLHFLDALMDAASEDGFPVQFLTEEDA